MNVKELQDFLQLQKIKKDHEIAQRISKYVRAVDDLYALIIDCLNAADPDHNMFHATTHEISIQENIGTFLINELCLDLGSSRVVFRPEGIFKCFGSGRSIINPSSRNIFADGAVSIFGFDGKKIFLYLNHKKYIKPDLTSKAVDYTGFNENGNNWVFNRVDFENELKPIEKSLFVYDASSLLKLLKEII